VAVVIDIPNPVATAIYPARHTGHFGMSVSIRGGITILIIPIKRRIHVCDGRTLYLPVNSFGSGAFSPNLQQQSFFMMNVPPFRSRNHFSFEQQSGLLYQHNPPRHIYHDALPSQ